MELLYLVRHDQLFWTTKGVWTTQDGKEYYVEELADSHLMNIPPYLYKNNRPIPHFISEEIKKRNMYIDFDNGYKVYKKNSPSKSFSKNKIPSIHKKRYSWKR